MDSWYAESMGNEKQCLERVMQAWFDGRGSSVYPITWEGLYELLEDAGFKRVAVDLEEAVKNAQ